MIRLNKWTAVCTALLLVATIMTGMTMAQNPPVPAPKAPDGAKVFEGSLLGVDQNAKVLTLKEGDKEMKFSFTDQTELIAPPAKDGKPPAVTQGTKMRIHYTEQETTNIATKIEILEPSSAR
jgi:hypothetical protein